MPGDEVLRRLLEARSRRVSVSWSEGRAALEVATGGDGDLTMRLSIPLSDLDVQRLRRDLADR